MLKLLPALLVLALMIYAVVDCLNTPEEEVRGLPRMVWLVIILVFSETLVGPLLWLFVGRRPVRVGGGEADGQADGPGAAPAPGPGAVSWIAPDDNPEFLKSLRADAGPVDKADTGPVKAGEDPAQAAEDADLLKEWEADLRRREEELRRRERGEEPGES